MAKPNADDWHELNNVAIAVDDKEVGRVVSLYEKVGSEWRRQYTMPAGQARDYHALLGEIVPEE